MTNLELTSYSTMKSDPMDYSLPVASIREIFQARVLEWGAIAFSVAILSIATVTIAMPRKTIPVGP